MPAINVNGGGFGGGSGNGSGSGSSGGGQSFRANFTTSSFGVAGVAIGGGELGPLSSGKLSAGRTFTASDANADVTLVNASYATQNKLATGSTITIAIGNSSGKATNFKVVGIVSEPAGDNPSDVYIPLAVAQNLAGMKNQVNTIYVTASNSSAINAVSGEISKALPGYTVTTSSDLASEVTGSLSSASSLANNLGKWLALTVLIAAFLLASLLTTAAVSRRVREFGTLKALGWKSRRIIGQVLGEFSGATKNYVKGRETVAALRGVDLVIEDGEWLAIQGPTGHGKSTLLQILGGLDRPSGGIVDFDGRGLAQLREAEVTRVRATSIGCVFQTFNLVPTLSAQENVDAALVPLHVSAAARRQRAAVALEAVGLGDRLRHVPGELSGG